MNQSHYPPQPINIPDQELSHHHLHEFKSDHESSSTNTNPTSFRYKTYQTAFGPLSLNHFLRKNWIKYYVLLAIIAILVGIVAVYHQQIVIALHPFVLSMRNLKINGVEVGWLIPVAVLFIISFPPLFGHEIVIILCGLVWGLWMGFGIVSLGTLLGELANYWTFKYACSHRAAKLEKKDLNYACMCVVIREGGFWIAFLARLSAIPGHLVTPVFATTGMSLFIFTAATVLSMPKQLAGVYLGTLFIADGDGGSQSQEGGSKTVKYSVIGVTFVVTIVAALYIYKKMAQARAAVVLGEHTPQTDSPSRLSTSRHVHQPLEGDKESTHLGYRPAHSPANPPFLAEDHHHYSRTPPSPASDDPSNPFGDHSGVPNLTTISSGYPSHPHWPPMALSNPFDDPPYAPLPPSDDPPPPSLSSIPYSLSHPSAHS